ncbi:GcrA family cell cycle regulator [Neorhizobium sp. T786]|uniref:GcrA family cell cycle regulator n=1 Tax=Pseudorhizobium xiangyangii TaxID=2883104 RepID=UPI001CFFA64F|nr:GcrA family cell cycle regulator [Neorhizobium xiangyangii]MCB5205025.1 GcrA family cell cycle regulator [Neorhizobium xiangyangii]
MNVHVKTPFKWTEEVMSQAAEMWNDGQSATQIGRALGVSRNAVIGKAHRNPSVFISKEGMGRDWRSGVTGARPVQRAPEPLVRRSKEAIERAKLKREAETAEATAMRLAIRDAKAGSEAYDTERLVHAKLLVDLDRGECHWPLNDGGPFLFCASETAKGSYCECHRLRMLPSRYTSDLEGI